MNPINAIKRRIAQRMARSGMVRSLVLKELETDEAALTKLGAKPGAFEHILNGAGKSETSLVRFIDHPDALARLMRSPKAFEKLLEAVSRNPESLFRVLEQRGVRRELKAQNKFLARVAGDKAVFMRMIENVGKNGRADAVQALVGDEASILRDMADAPEAMAASLLYRIGHGTTDPEVADAADNRIVEGVVATLGEHAAAVMLALVEENPNLLEDGPLHDQAMRSIRASAESISDLCAVYAVTPANGKSSSERVNKLLMQIFQEPVILRAMIKDATLRRNLFDIVRDSIEAAGEDVRDVMDAPAE